MRRYFLLIFLFFIPVMVKGESTKVSIDSVRMLEKSDYVWELDKAITNSESTDINLNMLDIGDKIKYELVLKNDSGENYQIDSSKLGSKSNYVSYTIEYEDNTDIIKANSSKKALLTIEYKNKIPQSEFKTGVFNDQKKLVLNVNNENLIFAENLLNPETLTGKSLILCIILSVISLMIIIVSKKRLSKNIVILIFTILIIPISVYALKKQELMININVAVTTKECSHNPRDLREFVMCELETDYHIAALKGLYLNSDGEENDGFQTEEDYIKFLKSYNFLIENFEWDSYQDRNINSSNFRNYHDGVYFDGVLLAPFYKEATINELLEISYKISNLGNYLSYSLSQDAINDLKGYSITKINRVGNGFRLRNVFSGVEYEKVSDNIFEIYLNGCKDFTRSDDNIEIEDVAVNGDFIFKIYKEIDAETGGERYYFDSEYMGNFENVSLSLFHNRIKPINYLINIYINKIRMDSNGYRQDIHDNSRTPAKYLVEFFDSAKEYGIIKYDWNEIINGKTDSKIDEILNLLEIDENYLNAYKAYHEANTLEEKNRIASNYYDSIGVLEHGVYNAGTVSNPIYYVTMKPIINYEDHITIAHNNKYYEGDNVVEKYLFDYYNITDSDWNEKLEKLYNYMEENSY